MDDKIIIDACAHLGLTTGETQDPLRVAAYVAALRDLKNEGAFVDAVDVLVNSTKHFPKIPEFREAYFAALSRQPKHEALGAGSGQLFPKGKWPDEVYDWVIQLRYDSAGHLVEAKRIKESF